MSSKKIILQGYAHSVRNIVLQGYASSTPASGTIQTQLTIQIPITGSVNTCLFLTTEVTGLVTTALFLITESVQLVDTALVIHVPFPYTPTEVVGSDISSLLHTSQNNARDRGTRETIKIASILRGAEKDLYSSDKTVSGKNGLIKTDILTFTASYNSSIRDIQHYRSQIQWRIGA